MKLIRKLTAAFVAAVILLLTGCAEKNAIPSAPSELCGLAFVEAAELEYAEQFAIYRYEDGYSLIYIMDGSRFLIVPEGKTAPDGLDSGITVLYQPLDNIYLAATAVMGLFAEMDCGDVIKFSGTRAEDWYIEYAREAMESGDMLYAGKYREPDYELLLRSECELAIESTMIGHSPEVKEKLIELGIPVFVDYSSYESHPLGRSEWIKLYGEMTGNADKAEQLFRAQAEQLEEIADTESTGKTVAFFYISTSGQAVTRKSGDYVSKMIQLAGGENVFKSTGDDDKATSTVTMEMEQFYSEARDADIIIYNSTMLGEISTIEELTAQNYLLADFKAVKNGDVWCTTENLFQETMKLGTVISDMHSVFTDNTENDPPVFLFKLESEAEH